MKSIKIDNLIAVLIILNIILCGYLTYSYSKGSKEGLCLINEENHLSCSDVQNSVYGSFLGMKVCHWGLISFTLLFFIFMYVKFGKKYQKEFKFIFLISTLLGSLIAFYFLIVQFFVLRTICSICIIIDANMIIIFILSYLEYYNNYKKRPRFIF